MAIEIPTFSTSIPVDSRDWTYQEYQDKYTDLENTVNDLEKKIPELKETVRLYCLKAPIWNLLQIKTDLDEQIVKCAQIFKEFETSRVSFKPYSESLPLLTDRFSQIRDKIHPLRDALDHSPDEVKATKRKQKCCIAVIIIGICVAIFAPVVAASIRA